MRKSLQYTEPIEKYYQRLWGVPEAAVRDLVRMYRETSILWDYKDFRDWFNRAYSYDITYSKWKGFEKYYKYYFKRKKLGLSKNVRVGKQFFK